MNLPELLALYAEKFPGKDAEDDFAAVCRVFDRDPESLMETIEKIVAEQEGQLSALDTLVVLVGLARMPQPLRAALIAHLLGWFRSEKGGP